MELMEEWNLAETVVSTIESQPAQYHRLYEDGESIEEKISKVA